MTELAFLCFPERLISPMWYPLIRPTQLKRSLVGFGGCAKLWCCGSREPGSLLRE